VTIPGRVVQQATGLQLPAADQTAIYGVEGGRPWRIRLDFGLPQYRNRVPVIEMQAKAWTAPPGREPERRLPWLLAGGVLGTSSWPRYPYDTRLTLAMANLKRPGATSTVGRTALGRSFAAAASSPKAEAFVRSPGCRTWLDRWETVVGPPRLLDAGIAPLLTSEVPHVTLVVQAIPEAPPAQYLQMLLEFGALLEDIERSFDAPVARETPIPTEQRDLVPGYPGPELSRLFQCPKCGRMERMLYLRAGIGVRIQAITGDCRTPLFAELPH
jgi:hypothetical protein